MMCVYGGAGGPEECIAFQVRRRVHELLTKQDLRAL